MEDKGEISDAAGSGDTQLWVYQEDRLGIETVRGGAAEKGAMFDAISTWQPT